MNVSNDNGSDRAVDVSAADPHGHAALQLTESLMHSLIASSTIDLDEAQNLLSIAIDATEEQANDLLTRPASLEKSISLLNDIKHSLDGSR